MAKPKEQAEITTLGKRVRYIGLGNAHFECDWCENTFSRGMISEYEDKRFCNEDCIKMYIRVNKST
jgi:hypothetical protein